MAFGNGIGVKLENLSFDRLFKLDYGAILVEIDTESDPAGIFDGLNYIKVGETVSEPVIITADGTVSLKDLLKAWESPLEKIFPTKTDGDISRVKTVSYTSGKKHKKEIHLARPRAFIPVFRVQTVNMILAQLESAGAITDVMVLRNLTAQEIEESVSQMKKHIDDAI